MSKQTIWATVVVVILVILGAWWAVATNESEVANEDDAAGLQAEDNAIVALDQKPDDEIVISEVVLVEDGFVVIHEVNEDGDPGEIIAASAFLEAGEEHMDVSIALSEEPADETELIAMLHSDNGDEIFDAEMDAPILSELGGPIMMSFMIDTAAGENFDVKL